ncbi:MAG TPA: hypothetical protein VMX12_08945 [Acidimicrobiia bacterium]|nr:hypothetical protein [Acidimicrobiia bacterium]
MSEWRYDEANGWHRHVDPDPSVADDVWVITERYASGSTGETTTVTTKARLLETLSFLHSEGSTWTVTHNGKPVEFQLVEH